jgi:hypothetical protein
MLLAALAAHNVEATKADTCGNPDHVSMSTGDLTFEFAGDGNPQYYFYRANSTEECYRMEFKHLYQVGSTGTKLDSQDLQTWAWDWPQAFNGNGPSAGFFDCVSVDSFAGDVNATETVAPPDMCSCLSDGSLCQFQMLGAKQAGMPHDVKIVNWYDTKATQSFLKFDLYVSNGLGSTQVGAPVDGTVQMNFRLRNARDDSDSDSGSDNDDSDSEDDDTNSDGDDDGTKLNGNYVKNIPRF